MAEFDYAYLADFADTNSGKITAVGASFTHIAAQSLPSQASMAIAGRFSMKADEDPAELNFVVEGPDGSFRLNFGGLLGPSGDVRPYGENGDKVGVLFAINLQVPLPKAGLYVVLISLDDELVRRLAFDVEAG